ncbi:MAG: response regulator transcription factor [Pseudomonadota bacterium]
MPPKKILVVEDEEDILKIVRYNLERAGYMFECAMSGEAALKQARTNLPDLMVLDLMLPGMDGLEVCKTIKKNERTASLPIIILTAKGEEADIVVGLEMGADDYMTKPFSPRVLISRIKAVLRRNDDKNLDVLSTISAGAIIIDTLKRQVLVNGEEVDLTATQFAILKAFARRPGWVFTRNQVINAVKGEDYAVTERSIDVHIVNLRKKMGNAGEFIETVRGVGYRFREE